MMPEAKYQRRVKATGCIGQGRPGMVVRGPWLEVCSCPVGEVCGMDLPRADFLLASGFESQHSIFASTCS